MSVYDFNTTAINLPDQGNVSQVNCEEFTTNLSLSFSGNESSNMTSAESTSKVISHVIKTYAMPMVCIFGIVGNALNLLVLTRKQLKCTMDRMEKSAHLGLLALAISDMFFCLLALMWSLAPLKPITTHKDFIGFIYYEVYYPPLVNIFVITSTWLTVIMALGRYVAICHPLHARGFINLNGTRISILLVFVGSVLINLPQFWYKYIIEFDCSGKTGCYCKFFIKKTTLLRQNNAFFMSYNICSSIVGIFIPLIVLTYCNVCLIQALRQSFKMQQMYRANQPKDSGHRITPTLITIIVLFTVLVAPAELLKFFEEFMMTKDTDSPQFYMHQNAIRITNFMMVINFAINFVLYCVINVQFRKTVKNILCCECGSKKSKYIKANHQEHTNMTVTCNVSDIETEM